MTPHKSPQDYIEEAVKSFDEKFLCEDNCAYDNHYEEGKCSCETGQYKSFLQTKLTEMHDLTWKEAREEMRLKILGLETVINGQQIQIKACLEAIDSLTPKD